MKRYLILIAAALLLTTGCEFEFTPELDSEAKLFVKCIAANDSICLQVKYAAPTSDQTKFPKVTPKLLEVTIGDQTLPVSLDNRGKGTVFAHAGKGETMGVHIETAELDEAYGYTQIPGLPRVKEVSVEYPKLTDSIKYTQIRIDMAEEPDPSDHYAVHIIREETGRLTDTVIVDTSYVMAIIQSETGSNAEYATLTYASGLFPFVEAPVILFPASAVKDKSCTLTLLSISYPPRGEVSISFRYKLLVSKVSDEFYHYAMALYKSSGDILATLGLAPPQFAWSNIEGGLGVCGAVRTIETDWYE